ncbi:MAG: CBS domain-containing protein [Myxococcota bacterium]|nr:CBS domain-containing protein [Myxococcota bacterium]
MHVRNLMTPAPVTISLRESIAKARGLMRTHDVRHLPVTENGRLVGLVSERDLYLLQSLSQEESDRQPVEEAMTESPYTVRPDDPMSSVAREMANHKYGCAVVVDEGRIVGIVTTVDALRALAATLTP